MKKELTLTKEEKIDFLVKLETDKNCNFLTKEANEGRKLFFGYQIFSTPMIFVAYFLATLLVTPTFNFFPQVVIAKMAADFAICFPMSVSHKRSDKEILEFISNGKISRKQYMYLLKSGELENWKQTYKNEVQQKVAEIKGITIKDYKQENVTYKTDGSVSYINPENLVIDVIKEETLNK